MSVASYRLAAIGLACVMVTPARRCAGFRVTVREAMERVRGVERHECLSRARERSRA